MSYPGNILQHCERAVLTTFIATVSMACFSFLQPPSPQANGQNTREVFSTDVGCATVWRGVEPPEQGVGVGGSGALGLSVSE